MYRGWVHACVLACQYFIMLVLRQRAYNLWSMRLLTYNPEEPCYSTPIIYTPLPLPLPLHSHHYYSHHSTPTTPTPLPSLPLPSPIHHYHSHNYHSHHRSHHYHSHRLRTITTPIAYVPLPLPTHTRAHAHTTHTEGMKLWDGIKPCVGHIVLLSLYTYNTHSHIYIHTKSSPLYSGPHS